MLFCPNKKKKKSKLPSPADWEAVGSCFYLRAGWPWRGHWPLLLFQWHLHSLSLRNNISHAALFFLLLTYADPIFKVRACTKGEKLFSFFSFFLRTVKSVYFHLFNLLKTKMKIRPHKTKRQRKEKSLAAFFLWQNNSCTELEINIISATEKKPTKKQKKKNNQTPDRVSHKAEMLRVFTSPLNQCRIKPISLQEGTQKQTHFEAF